MLIIRELNVRHVHLGPSCGTFSRAREIPVPRWKVEQGAPDPKPLRSEEYPLGLPNLVVSQRARVANVNSWQKHVRRWRSYV